MAQEVDWKLSLPVDENGDDSSDAQHVDERNRASHEVKDDDLIDYEAAPWFYAKEGEVFFRAHAAGASATAGSGGGTRSLRLVCCRV